MPLFLLIREFINTIYKNLLVYCEYHWLNPIATILSKSLSLVNFSLSNISYFGDPNPRVTKILLILVKILMIWDPDLKSVIPGLIPKVNMWIFHNREKILESRPIQILTVTQNRVIKEKDDLPVVHTTKKILSLYPTGYKLKTNRKRIKNK